ncbi:MAG: Hint domain-containing protein [Rhodobacteraceae bacterium]|nr:Hint domain-containing protein [Paracoccaceae bacterium]
MADSDVQTASGTINPNSNNPISVEQTSTLDTVDGNEVGRDGFDLSIDLTGTDVADKINIAIVIDTSGSTDDDSGTDFNGDGSTDTILVAELYAAAELFKAYIDAGYESDDVTISLITYATGAYSYGSFTLDEIDEFIDALEHINDDGSSGWTNYEDGLHAVGDEWSDNGASATDTNVVVFMSDGFALPEGQDISGAAGSLEATWGATISGIGLGAASGLDDLNELDNTPGGAQQVLSGQELLDIIVEPLTDADFLRFEIVIDGFDENGDPVQQTITLLENDPAVTSTQLGWTVNSYELDPGFPVGSDIKVTVNSFFSEHPADSGNGEQVITTIHNVTVIVCFTLGTKILTPDGAVDIETLVAGDRVVTRDHGVQIIRWIGSTIVGVNRLAANPHLRPVLIRKGALGENQPESDMRVSRQHKILVRDWRAEVMFGSEGGVLVPAFTLCNDQSIMVEDQTEPLTYIHMAFDNHEVIYAEGVETESFQPADRVVQNMNSDQRAELQELFPYLSEGEGDNLDAARKQPVAREARVLAPK